MCFWQGVESVRERRRRATHRYGAAVSTACIVGRSDLSVKQRRAMCFPSGTRRYVCKSADSVVSVREERDDARVIGRRAGRVSGGAERWQHRTRGNQCVIEKKRKSNLCVSGGAHL